jgi:hypothetical protein
MLYFFSFPTASGGGNDEAIPSGRQAAKLREIHNPYSQKRI